MSTAATKRSPASAASAALATRSARGTLFFPLIPLSALAAARGARSSAERRYMLEILTALRPHAVGSWPGSWSATSVWGLPRLSVVEIEVARRVADVVLDMGPSILGRPQAPLLLIRRNQEDAGAHGSRRMGIERISPGPVPRRLQRQSDAEAQMVERRLPKPGRRRPGLALRQLRRAPERRASARRLARRSAARPAGARSHARRAPRRSGSRPPEDRRRNRALTDVGRVQGSTPSHFAGSPGIASIKAAAIRPRSTRAPIGGATERSSRSPQALRWAGAFVGQSRP